MEQKRNGAGKKANLKRVIALCAAGALLLGFLGQIVMNLMMV